MIEDDEKILEQIMNKNFNNNMNQEIDDINERKERLK